MTVEGMAHQKPFIAVRIDIDTVNAHCTLTVLGTTLAILAIKVGYKGIAIFAMCWKLFFG